MFDNMFKKKKQVVKKTEDKDNSDFSYDEDLKTNEFNDATIEYGEGEIEEDTEDEGFVEEDEIDKNKILFWSLIAFLVLLIIVMLIVRGCVLSAGKLSNINLTAGNVIYVGEKSEIEVSAIGSGNLKQTAYKFESSNNTIVEIEAKGFVQGQSAKNTLIPITTGNFILEASAKLDDVLLQPVSKEITICRRLTNESLPEKLIAVVGVKTKLVLDLGEDEKCYDKITYKIRNNSLLKIDSEMNLVGVKAGTTTLTISDGKKTITREVEVAENGIKVTGLTLDTNSISLKVNSTKKVTAIIKPTDATNQNVIWTSSNAGVATVSKTGLITGIGKGTTIVTAETEEGGYKAIVMVNITGSSSSDEPSNPTPTPTNVAPTIKSMSITSNNGSYAKTGSIITINLKFSENIKKPTINLVTDKEFSDIAPSDISGSGTTWKATYEIPAKSSTIDAADGQISVSIKYYDTTGKSAATNPEKRTTNIILDRTNPKCTLKAEKLTSYVKTLTATITEKNQITNQYSWDGKKTYVKDNTYKAIDNIKYSLYVKDAAGNIGSCNTTVSGIVTTGPQVTGVKIQGPDGKEGTYGVGKKVTIEVTFNRTLKLTGAAPTLQVKATNQKTYTKATYEKLESNKLIYTYTIKSGDTGLILVANKLIKNGKLTSTSNSYLEAIYNLNNISGNVIADTVAGCKIALKDNLIQTKGKTLVVTGFKEDLSGATYSWDKKNYLSSNTTKVITKNGTYSAWIKDKYGNIGECNIVATITYTVKFTLAKDTVSSIGASSLSCTLTGENETCGMKFPNITLLKSANNYYRLNPYWHRCVHDITDSRGFNCSNTGSVLNYPNHFHIIGSNDVYCAMGLIS